MELTGMRRRHTADGREGMEHTWPRGDGRPAEGTALRQLALAARCVREEDGARSEAERGSCAGRRTRRRLRVPRRQAGAGAAHGLGMAEGRISGGEEPVKKAGGPRRGVRKCRPSVAAWGRRARPRNRVAGGGDPLGGVRSVGEGGAPWRGRPRRSAGPQPRRWRQGHRKRSGDASGVEEALAAEAGAGVKGAAEAAELGKAGAGWPTGARRCRRRWRLRRRRARRAAGGRWGGRAMRRRSAGGEGSATAVCGKTGGGALEKSARGEKKGGVGKREGRLVGPTGRKKKKRRCRHGLRPSKRAGMFHSPPSKNWLNAQGNSSGFIVKKTMRMDIPVDNYPNFNIVGRLLGPRRNSLKRVEASTDCPVLIRGRGSIKDPAREELMRGKPGYEHLDEPLHLVIEAELPAEIIDIRLMQTQEIIDDMLKPVDESVDFFKMQQLRELAMINGTLRDDGSQNSGSVLPFHNSMSMKRAKTHG